MLKTHIFLQIVTRANPVVVQPVKKAIPWWVILAAALGGVFLLALFAFIMWKVSSFKCGLVIILHHRCKL